MNAPITAKAALLQALTAGQGYGLELIQRVSDQTGGEVSLGQGSVYPALRELERDGFLTSSEDAERAADRGGLPRRYYRLTPAGRREARRHRAAVISLFDLVAAT